MCACLPKLLLKFLWQVKVLSKEVFEYNGILAQGALVLPVFKVINRKILSILLNKFVKNSDI